MAKERYPFAYIIQGDFAGQYVYFYEIDNRYYIRSESSYKEGFLSMGIWYQASYGYILRNIVGYEDIGSATHTADAASVIKGGLMLGVVGAMAASAAGSRTTFDTQIYFKDGKKSVFRFLSAGAHQDYITAFHQLNIKPGNPTVINTNTARNPITNNPPTGRKLPSTLPKKPDVPQNIQKPKDCVEDINQIDPNRIYNLYCIGIVRDKITGTSHASTTLLQYGYSNPNDALGKMLMKAVPGSRAIKKMKSRDGVCYGAVLVLNANQPVSHSNAKAPQKQDGYLTKPHLIDADGIYDVYCVSYDKSNIGGACEQLEKLGVLNVTKENIDSYIDKVLLAGATGKRTIKLINSNNGIKYGAKLSTETPKSAEAAAEPQENKASSQIVSQAPQESHEEKPAASNSLSYIEELKQLKELVDLGIITQEEFDAKKKQLLGL